jgi:hypothetical protein
MKTETEGQEKRVDLREHSEKWQSSVSGDGWGEKGVEDGGWFLDL